MKASQLKKGNVVAINGDPYRVKDIDISSPTARGGNTLYRVKFTSIVTGQNLDQSFKGNDNLEELALDRRAVTYLYADADFYHFMDSESYDQHSLSVDSLGEQRDWLSEDMEGLTALTMDGQMLALELPATVEFDIEETAPVIKGATATNRNKPATLTNGRVVMVPEYLESGVRVRVNTETEKYMARVR